MKVFAMRGKKVLFILICAAMCASYHVTAQDKGAKSKSVDQASKDIEKKKWEHQRDVDRATKKALKAHMDHQTKDVRKRMKKDARRAAKNNREG